MPEHQVVGHSRRRRWTSIDFGLLLLLLLLLLLNTQLLHLLAQLTDIPHQLVVLCPQEFRFRRTAEGTVQGQ